MNPVVRRTWGVAVEVGDAPALCRAAETLRQAGYRDFDAYAPFPVHGLDEHMGLPASPLPWFTLVGGIVGAVAGFALQAWVNVLDYPLNVGGRPPLSWPAFLPITFECGVLGAGLATVFGLFYLARLPRPHHPMFEVPGFSRVSDDGFFVCVPSSDPAFDEQATPALLDSLGGGRSFDVEA